MTSLLGRLFGEHPVMARAPMRGDLAYANAMSKSDELLTRMRESRSDDAAVAVMADIWAQRRNIPFLTTIVETTQELKAPIAQRPDDLSTPKSSE